MQIARDAFAFCDLREILDLFLRPPELLSLPMPLPVVHIDGSDNQREQGHVDPVVNKQAEERRFCEEDGHHAMSLSFGSSRIGAIILVSRTFEQESSRGAAIQMSTARRTHR